MQYRVRFLSAQAPETMRLQAADAATAVAMAKAANSDGASAFELLSVTLDPGSASSVPGAARRDASNPVQ